MAIVLQAVKWSKWNIATQVYDRSCICQPANCAYELANSGSYYSETLYLADHNIREDLCSNSNVAMTFAWDSFATIGNTFDVTTSNTNLYSTGCVHGSGSANITVPSGTTKIQVLVQGSCANVGADQWSYSLLCV